jgi:hypothetical protein
MSDPIGFFLVLAFLFAFGSVTLVASKAIRIIPIRWGPTLLLALALAVAAWYCLFTAHKISANV